jgi:hypothetical protein
MTCHNRARHCRSPYSTLTGLGRWVTEIKGGEFIDSIVPKSMQQEAVRVDSEGNVGMPQPFGSG